MSRPTPPPAARPGCRHPGCSHPAARRYDRPGRFRLWCDRHTRAARRRKRPPALPLDPPATLDPVSTECPVPGCLRKRELRRRHADGTAVLRNTCQAHRGVIDFTPPPPKPRTPWKPEPAPPSPSPNPTPERAVRAERPERPRRVPTPNPRLLPQSQGVAATITTASDGAWEVTFSDLTLMAQHHTMPAFVVSTLPALSRPLPTSVVYRVWGMMERGELVLEEP